MSLDTDLITITLLAKAAESVASLILKLKSVWERK